MKDIILMAAVLLIFAFGFFVTHCLDTFLEENYKNTLIDVDKKEPSCVVLSGSLSDEEIIEEIHRFRKNHEKIEVYIKEDNSSGIT